MSNEGDNFYFHNRNHENQYGNTTSDYSFSSNSLPHEGFDPNSPYMSFTDCFQGSSYEFNDLERDLSLSPPSWETKAIDGVEVSFTPKPPVLSQLSEDGSVKGKENILQKSSDDGEQTSKKENILKKKCYKKEVREPRFAFMTSSEVDHLEDGYRWRKYGQKAVKNSLFPRSYYRCTTQKCSVKKRVERSNQDPSIVITTYEGQHNHPIPTTFKGHVRPTNNYGVRTAMSSFYPQQSNVDYGVSQDMARSQMFYAQEQRE